MEDKNIFGTGLNLIVGPWASCCGIIWKSLILVILTRETSMLSFATYIDHLKTGGSSIGEVLSLGIVPLVLMRVRATP